MKNILSLFLLAAGLYAQTLLDHKGAALGPNGGTLPPANCAGANLVVACVEYYAPGTLSVGDQVGNTYTPLTIYSTGGTALRMYYAQNATPNPALVLSVVGGGSYASAHMGCFGGVAASAFEPGTDQGNQSSSATSLQTSTPALFSANSLLVTCAAAGEPSSLSVSNSVPYTLEDPIVYVNGNNEGGALAYSVQTTAGSTQPTWNGFGAGPNAIAMAGFLGGAPPPPPLVTISASPSSLTFTATQGSSSPASQTISISSSSPTTFTATASSTPAGWLSISPSGGLTTPATVTDSVVLGSLAAGTYSGSITFSGTNNTVVVPVTLIVNAVPPPPSGPVISNLKVSPQAVLISWTTDTFSTTQVCYGPTTAYGTCLAGDTFPSGAIFLHDVWIQGSALTIGTTYHFQVSSSANGQTTLVPDETFTY